MAPQPSPPTSAMSSRGDSPAGGNDWAAQITAKVGELVGLVRDKTLTPAVKVVRLVVLALLGIFIVGLVIVMISVGVLRVLDTEVFHRRVWASYLVAGGIFAAIGLFLTMMRKRRV